MTVARMEQVLIKFVFYLLFHQGRGAETKRNCSSSYSWLVLSNENLE